MDENFLLQTPLSRRLYHGCAEKLPVIDYHNHLNIRELAEGTNYPDLARLWLISDPYKHRAMRICGVDEFYITGGASDYDKFRKWMSVLPRLIGNPLYDWSILEMKRCFRIELQPGVTDADWLWETAGKMLARPEFSVQSLLDRFHVEYAAPCAAITEDIAALERMGNAAPSLRGDGLTDTVRQTADGLEQLLQLQIRTLEDYYAAIRRRLEDFAARAAGSRIMPWMMASYIKSRGSRQRRCLKRAETADC